MMPAVAREITIGARRFWITSEPAGDGWTARVAEVLDSAANVTRDLGIEATGGTRGLADTAAHAKLLRWLAAEGGKKAGA